MRNLIQALLLAGMVLLSGCVEEVVTMDQPAPSLAAVALDGEPVAWGDYANTVKYLVFWSSSCGACMDAMPVLEALAIENPDTLIIIAINIDTDLDSLAELVKQTKLTFPVLQDQLGITQERYRVIGTPTAFVIDKEGIVRDAFQGMMSHRALRQFIRSTINKYS